MLGGKLRLYYLYLKYYLTQTPKDIWGRLRAWLHRKTWRATATPKNVVLLGGSFAGFELSRQLVHRLPSGYRVIMIERNSHFNYTFNFPRYSVLQGHEHKAFLPFTGITDSAPKGIWKHVRGEITDVDSECVRLANGQTVPYSYLVIATGAAQTPPAKLLASDRKLACEELQVFQESIKASQRIAIVGAGAVGVEIACDIKYFYPHKDVTLVHSRNAILQRFGPKLQAHALAEVKKLGIEVMLKQRPTTIPCGDPDKDKKGLGQSLAFPNGEVVNYDLVIPCTGQSPNSGIISSLAPEAISASTGRILVHPTLQISSKGHASRIFAVGDVAETPGPKMARAALNQVNIVCANLLSLIRGGKATREYIPNHELEGSLHLTLGVKNWATWFHPEGKDEVLITGDNGKENLYIEGAWKYWGARIEEAGM
ncbi:Pyridine nucleotide-disulfide oxidoreductase-like protein 10 [Elsinoe fawcettii]|nr:Pyridine nucleotide-disulfide oxidoreductase-like protein 10 [Elsinoe fawcettii]